jgi:hypothetical protein
MSRKGAEPLQFDILPIASSDTFNGSVLESSTRDIFNTINYFNHIQRKSAVLLIVKFG